MPDPKLGPLDSNELGPQWIDSGTLARTRFRPPVPAGLHDPSPKQAAPPKDEELSEEEVDKLLIEENIHFISESPSTDANRRKKIVNKLKQLNQQDLIKYSEEIGDDRGQCGGGNILINKKFHRSSLAIPVLVHEGLHAIWAAEHPLPTDRKKLFRYHVDEELQAQIEELEIYKHLKTKFKELEDPILEMRLKNQKTGNLKKVIEQNMSALNQ